MPRHRVVVLLLAVAVAPDLRATVPNEADDSIRQFLARENPQPPSYRATRRLEAANGRRSGWVEAVTEYAPGTGFRYEITEEGGSSYIRSRVLRAVLDGERDLIAGGETGRAALVRSNYYFQPDGLDPDGLAKVLLSPRRRERVLLAGAMFLRPSGGDLVRLEGRLAKSPSFWVKNVDIVRTYERIQGAVVPVAFESTAQVRLLGAARLRMTYVYTEIDGRQVP